MAGTSIRKSVAEPDHVLYGVPTITYASFVFFPLGAAFTVAGANNAMMIGVFLTFLTHVVSIILRFRQPFMERLIWYHADNLMARWVTKKEKRYAAQRSVRLYIR